MIDRLLSDFRLGARALLRRPGFTGIAVLMLALGIGANTAIFSVVNGVLLRPLPYAEPGRLVDVAHTNPRESLLNGLFSTPDLADLQRESPQFASLAGYFHRPGLGMVNLSGNGDPARVQGAFVGGRFFETLGVAPLLGRAIALEHDDPGRARVAVLSESLWRTRFGGHADAVGRTLSIEGEAYVIIGVMPQRFQYPARDVQLWLPLSLLDAGDVGPLTRGNRWLAAVARLAPGVDPAAAAARTSASLEALAAQYPETNQHWTKATLTPLMERVTAAARTPLLVLLGAVGMVLLIASANLANLLLARASGRSRELAVRAALGARGSRLAAQIVTENLALALLGGGLGLVLAFWGTELIVAAARDQIPRPDEVSIDAPVLAFALAATLLAGLLASVLPALRASAAQPGDALREGARAGTGAVRQRARALLVVVETGLAVVLLVSSMLMVRSVWQLMQVDPGFDAERVLALNVSVPGDRFDSPAALVEYRERVLDRMRALPGVISVGGAKTAPLTGGGEPMEFSMDGPDGGALRVAPEGGTFFVSPDYFRTIGTRVLAGREFTAADIAAELELVPVVVNQAAAERYWPGRTALGQRIAINGTPLEVVGIVQDVRTNGLAEAAPPAVYLLWTLAPRVSVHVFMRTAAAPETLIPAVRSAVRELDADLPIGSLQPLSALVAADIAQPRLLATLLAAFAAVAVLLAALGIYGVIAYAVTLRGHEIGVRMALGALRRDVIAMVVAQALRIAGIGTLLGVGAALASTRVLRGLLHGISTTDPLTFVAVPVLLMAVAALAAALPARRAARLDPMVAFRTE